MRLKRWLALGLLCGPTPLTLASENNKRITLDYGVNSLYLLLDNEGRHATIEELQRRLPPRPAQGYSMSELASASRSLGLPLDEVSLLSTNHTLKRPIIVYLKDAEAGHFATLIPVGTTGTMAQLLKG